MLVPPCSHSLGAPSRFCTARRDTSLGLIFIYFTVYHTLSPPTSLWHLAATYMPAFAFLLLRSLAQPSPSRATCWSPPSWYMLFGALAFVSYFYIGKTVDFMARVRRHTYGFLRSDSAHPQPYATFLCGRAGGDAPRALSQLIFTPTARCFSDEAATKTLRHLIDTEHPPLNEPYIRRLLSSACARHGHRPHLMARMTVTARPPTRPARFSHKRSFPREVKPRNVQSAQAMSSSSHAQSDDIAFWASGVCNTRGKPTSGRCRRAIFNLTPTT